LNDLGLLKIG